MAKAVYIARRCSGDKVRAVVSIVVDRIMGVLSLLFVGSLASLLVMERFPVFASTVWLIGAGTLVFCFCLSVQGCAGCCASMRWWCDWPGADR